MMVVTPDPLALGIQHQFPVQEHGPTLSDLLGGLGPTLS